MKGVALNPNTCLQFTDHLAPICVIMDIPLLVTDELYNQQVQQYYPELKTLLMEWLKFTPQYLIENFDVFFQSEPWERTSFYRNFESLEKKFNKVVRNVHCPHGFSDKIFWLEKCVYEDITLVYGENMLDQFREQGLEKKLNVYVRVGNYRFAYYKRHQPFFDALAEKEIFSQFSSKKPIILYAPTCQDPEKNSSFLFSDPLFQNLPSDYNLLVKLHPVLEETHSPQLYKAIGKYEKQGNIVFVKDFTLIYPILAKSDIYVGDMSSIGYDFLVFNRPMFFLNQLRRDSRKDRNTFLYKCGIEIFPEEYSKLYSIIDANLDSDRERFYEIRQNMYHYTFDPEVPFDRLRQNIIKSYSSPKKWV